MPKKTKSDPVWSIYKMAAKTQHLGQVTAKDEKQAIERAKKELDINPADHFRLMARPF
jgi:hypothetical protein